MKLKTIDKNMLCELITNRYSTKSIAEHFGVGREVIRRRAKLFGFKILRPVPKKHSTETKEKMSIGRKKYLSENPDKHPWRNNNKFKSAPCEKVKEWLKSNSVSFVEEFQPLLNVGKNYSIDIAFPDKLIGIEVNGNQHYESNGMLKPYYQTRQKEIEASGWKLYQLHYSMCYKPELLCATIGKIHNADVKLNFDYVTYKKARKIKKSEVNPDWNHEPKFYCRKVPRPSKEELETLIKSIPMTTIGKKFGVSCNAIRQWCKSYNIDRSIQIFNRPHLKST